MGHSPQPPRPSHSLRRRSNESSRLGPGIFRDAANDIRIAFRTLRRVPAFTVTAVGILALGIGAVGTVFSVARSVLLKPPAFERPEELVIVWGTSKVHGQSRDVISGPNYIDLRERNDVLSGLAAFKTDGATLYLDGRPVPTSGLRATPEFFDVLRVPAYLGRTFEPADGEQGRGQVVVISHGLWQRHFGGRPEAVGSLLETYDRRYTVVGVLPEKFEFHADTDVVFPLSYDMLRNRGRTSIDYWAIGRLKDGVTVGRAQENLKGIMADLRSEFPRLRRWDVSVELFQETLFEYLRPPIVLLLVTAGLAVLLACANVANLLLARGVGRAREIAVRTSLGASPWRLRRQLLTESTAIGLLGGLSGIGLAAVAVQQMPLFLPTAVPVPGSAATALLPNVSLDAGVLTLTATATLLTAILFGLSPAYQASRADPGLVMRAGARSSVGRRSLRSQKTVVVSQLALTLVLVAVATAMVRSTLDLLSVDLGLEPRRLVTLYFGDLGSWDHSRRADYYRQVMEAVEAVPGVESVGINDYVPLQQEDDFAGFTIQDEHGIEHHRTEWRRVSAEYFKTAGVALLRGRSFTDADNERAPSVAVINQAMADRYWPGENPVGQRIVVHQRAYASSEIVGVVGDVRRRGLDQAAPAVLYVPFQRRPRPVVALFAKTRGDSEALMNPIKEAIWSVDPRQPIERVQTMGKVVANSVAMPRIVLSLVALAAVAATVLAAVGVYGVISYAVSRRRREMSIRMALGASGLRVQCEIIWSGMRLALPAIILGTVAAFLIVRGVSSLLFDLRPTDPLPFLVAAGIVLLVAALACYFPARTTSRLDPAASLQAE